MKALFIVFFLIFLAQAIKAQDLIVTKEGEYLECKIEKIDATHIYYNYKYGSQTNEASISRGLVKHYKTNHFKQKGAEFNSFSSESHPFPRLRMALNSGVSYRTGKIPKGLPEVLSNYMEGVKTGYHIGGYLGCAYTEGFGIGVKGTHFRSTNSMEDISITYEDGKVRNGKMEDDITISYFGPALSSTFILKPYNSILLANLSFGLIHYRNKATVIDPFILRGNNIGFSLDLGYDKPVSRNLAWGIQLSFVAGYLSQLEMEKGPKRETVHLNEGSYENLSRLDLSLGIRFR